MFLSVSKSGYDRYGAQYAHGWFLVLANEAGASGEDIFKVRGFVVYAKMSQLGHWMMARTKIKGHKVSLSGGFGQDGHAKDFPSELFKHGVPLPDDLIQAYKSDNGWNCVGNPEPFRKWAKENFKALHNASLKRTKVC